MSDPTRNSLLDIARDDRGGGRRLRQLARLVFVAEDRAAKIAFGVGCHPGWSLK